MQKQKISPSYGMTKIEYARRLKELEAQASQPGGGLLARFWKKAE